MSSGDAVLDARWRALWGPQALTGDPGEEALRALRAHPPLAIATRLLDALHAEAALVPSLPLAPTDAYMALSTTEKRKADAIAVVHTHRADVVRRLIGVVAAIGGAEAETALLALAAEHPDERTARAAARAILGDAGLDPSATPLPMSHVALDALSRTFEAEAAVDRPDARSRASLAARARLAIDEPRALTALDDSDAHALPMLDALTETRTLRADASTKLAALVDTRSNAVRVAALGVAQRHPSEALVERAAVALDDPDPHVRAAAGRVSAAHPTPAAASVALARLEHGEANDVAAKQLVDIIGAVGDVDAIARLAALVPSARPSMMVTVALKVIDRRGDARCASFLRAMADAFEAAWPRWPEGPRVRAIAARLG